MAKVDVKRMTLIAFRSHREALFERFERVEGVHIVLADEFEPELLELTRPLDLNEELRDVDERIALLQTALDTMGRLAPEKKGMFTLKPEVGMSRLDAVYDDMDALLDTCRGVSKLEGELLELRTRKARHAAAVEQLRPLAGLDVPLKDIAATGTTELMLGSVPASAYPAFMEGLSGMPLLDLRVAGETPDARYVLIAAHKSVAGGVNEALRQHAFTRLNLSETLAPDAAVAAHEKEIAAIDARRAAAEDEVKGHAERRGELQLLYDALDIKRERARAATMLAATEETFAMTAWARADRIAAIDRIVTENAPEAYVIYEDALEEDDAPTALSNNTFVTPFESITEMFSAPSRGDVDPNPVMAPFFILFFGMMFGDAAYGVILMLACIYATRKLKLRGMMGDIAKVLIGGGAMTVFWGIMFGSYFGESFLPPVLLNPMNDPINMLVLCYTLGLLHLFTGMVVKAVNAIKHGDWQTALFDQFAWMFLILGLVAAVVGGMVSPILSTVGMWTAIVCVALILLFAGREKGLSVGRFMSGLSSLYGITGYLSDVLSYSRLFALGLSTSVICMVFNILAGLMTGSAIGYIPAIAVLLVGHAFNFLINALGAYVHSCRLQYIEFFGKFYDGGGRAFRPLMRRTKFVNLSR